MLKNCWPFVVDSCAQKAPVMRICAVIPAYNSQSTIARVVSQTRLYVQQVVVVDDGSADRTARCASLAGAHVIGCGKNRGKGYALALGFRYFLGQGFDAVITLDADLQHDASDIPHFIRRFDFSGADLIIGDRLHSRRDIPRLRFVPNWVGTHCFSWLTGQVILDSQCGFRFYHRRLLAALPVLCDGFDAESDLLLRAGRKGFKIDFVPVKVIYHEKCRKSKKRGKIGKNKGCYTSFYRPVRDTYAICINFLKNWFWRKR
ncbi:MAG: glycosyltransferase family 2 protein [Desulfobacteraceae bacterium]|nr:glycosyltransferase family 2 protein [Desulfobacteraceae bacterium]